MSLPIDFAFIFSWEYSPLCLFNCNRSHGSVLVERFSRERRRRIAKLIKLQIKEIKQKPREKFQRSFWKKRIFLRKLQKKHAKVSGAFPWRNGWILEQQQFVIHCPHHHQNHCNSLLVKMNEWMQKRGILVRREHIRKQELACLKAPPYHQNWLFHGFTHSLFVSSSWSTFFLVWVKSSNWIGGDWTGSRRVFTLPNRVMMMMNFKAKDPEDWTGFQRPANGPAVEWWWQKREKVEITENVNKNHNDRSLWMDARSSLNCRVWTKRGWRLTGVHWTVESTCADGFCFILDQVFKLFSIP